MKIEKEYRDDHQVKLTVDIDQDTFESAKHRAARQIAKKVKIPGFRPGKAPYVVIVRQVGEGNIVEQALEILIEEQYPTIIKEAEIEPFGPGSLENVSKLDPPTLEFVIPLDAVVELGDYKSIRIPYEPTPVNDGDVDSAIKRVQEQHATRESVERPAHIGDVVYMRLSGTRMNLDDDTETTIVEERFSSATIKAESDPKEWPFPGFSQALIGLVAEEEKLIPYHYPTDYEDKKLQGAEVEFRVVVTNVQSLTLPEIDDDLAKTASEFDTLDEWKSNLRLAIEEQAQESYAENYDDQVIDQVVSMSTIKFPPQMIEGEKEEILRGLEYRLSQQGISKELYLQIRGIDETALNEELTPVAEERVKRSLVLMKVAKTEDIKADPDSVRAEVDRTIDAISSSMNPNDFKKLAKTNYLPSLATSVIADFLSSTTLEYLRVTAKGETWSPKNVETDSTPKSEEVLDQANPDEVRNRTQTKNGSDAELTKGEEQEKPEDNVTPDSATIPPTD